MRSHWGRWSLLKSEPHRAAALRMRRRMIHAAAVAGGERVVQRALLAVHGLADVHVEPVVVGDQPLARGLVRIEIAGVFRFEPERLLSAVGSVERLGFGDIQGTLALE